MANLTLGTVQVPIFARFNGTDTEVGVITVDIKLAPDQQAGIMQDITDALSTPADTNPDDETATELACAWSDYRAAYGALPVEHKAFKAGWDAAHGTQHQGVLR